MNISGKSLIPIKADVLATALERAYPNLPHNLELRFDPRATVVSSFAKFVSFNSRRPQIRLYPSCINLFWEDIFVVSDGVETEQEALIFFAGLMCKFAILDEEIDVKRNGVEKLRDLELFLDYLYEFDSLKNSYAELVASLNSANNRVPVSTQTLEETPTQEEVTPQSTEEVVESPKETTDSEDVAQQLLHQIDEQQRALEENIVSSSEFDDLDLL